MNYQCNQGMTHHRFHLLYLCRVLEFRPSVFVHLAEVDVVHPALFGRDVQDVLTNLLEEELCPFPHVSRQLVQRFVHGQAFARFLTLVEATRVVGGEGLGVAAVAQPATAARVHAVPGGGS